MGLKGFLIETNHFGSTSYCEVKFILQRSRVRKMISIQADKVILNGLTLEWKMHKQIYSKQVTLKLGRFVLFQVIGSSSSVGNGWGKDLFLC